MPKQNKQACMNQAKNAQAALTINIDSKPGKQEIKE
jgi:hypothetical protein